MRKVKIITAGLSILLLFSLPTATDVRGELFSGFGAGLLTGSLAVPTPVYVAPAQVAQVSPGNIPAPPAGQIPPPPEVPLPPVPPTTGTPPAPGNQAKCREWKMIDRHFEDRWDPYYRKRRQVPVEKWDWVEVPCSSEAASVAVQGNANIAPPPEYILSAPPQVAVIPGTYVYVVPGIGVDILFYHGQWYRPYGGHWYWAESYNGPWVNLALASVPRVLLELPPGYRRLPPGYRRIPYGELHANWERWERERYWHRDKAWGEGWRRP